LLPVRLQLIRSLRQHPVESSRGALRHPGFGLSARAPRLHPHRLPSRLTSRSSRRRVGASLKLPGMRAILAPIHRVRRGLTPALGGRKAFCNCADRMHESPASVSVSFRIHSRRVASSSESAARAHTSHALRSPASEAKCALRPVRQRLIRSLRLYPAESSEARSSIRASAFRQVRRGFTLPGFLPA
jgi:hypothetical protein